MLSVEDKLLQKIQQTNERENQQRQKCEAQLYV